MNTRESIWYKIIHYGLEFIGRYYSSYRAFVVNNDDPLGLNRLQLRIPVVNEFKDDPTWAFPKGNFGSKDYGIQMLPRIGDMVWVEFEFGDLDYPIWSFASYGLNERPKEFKTVNHIGLKTYNGSIILLNDNKDQESITIGLKNGDFFKLENDLLTLESKLIQLGSSGDEKAVLGNTLLDKLDELIDKVNSLIGHLNTHSHPANNTPPLTSDIANFNTVKADLISLKNNLAEFLSNKVKIDE